MPTKLSIETWERKDQFHFFKQFEEPFFGVTLCMDCTATYRTAKQNGTSFFLHYLHKALVAVNTLAPFRYRIQNDEVLVYETVHASPTINRENGTFGFAYMDYHPDFEPFAADAQKEIERVRKSTGLVPATSSENVIHFSSLPWLDFTSVSHARAFSFKDSIPKITFGKMTEKDGRRFMPVSVHVHHALMDGYHVGLFAEIFQDLLNQA